MPVLLVGEALGPAGSPFDPRTRPGARLAELMGVGDIRAGSFGVVNLIDRWPGKTSHGAGFPSGQARQAATRLKASVPEDVVFVLVGRRVARAFGFPTEPYLTWFFRIVDDRDYAIFPHPSGGRWWSVPGNERDAKRFLRSLAKIA